MSNGNMVEELRRMAAARELETGPALGLALAALAQVLEDGATREKRIKNLEVSDRRLTALMAIVVAIITVTGTLLVTYLGGL